MPQVGFFCYDLLFLSFFIKKATFQVKKKEKSK